MIVDTASRPRRVLIVANFDRRHHQATFYNVEALLYSGLIRAGHHVIAFSDRDTAREASPLQWSSRLGGVATMRRRLLSTAKHYLPDLILFGHVDLVDRATLQDLRQHVPGTRLAQFNVDAVFNSRSMSTFLSRTMFVDVSFITTADLGTLDLPSTRRGAIHYFPNPVDFSIYVARTFERTRDELPFDGQFLGGYRKSRDKQIDSLVSNLPADYRFRSSIRDLGGRRLRSIEFLSALAEAGCVPNLAHDDTVAVPYLYSSDRIAQCMGQGVAALTHTSARLREIYDDGVIEFNGLEHLTELMTFLQRNDGARQRLSERGWRIVHDRMASHRVSKYMLEVALNIRLSEQYGWPVASVADKG